MAKDTQTQIISADFVRSLKGTDKMLSGGMPQVAFIGRSNVGKSSLINSLTGKKGLAISSSTPGRTRLINVFNINNQRYFVDLPGYGFARFEKKDAERMQKMLLWYLVDLEMRPRVTVLIVDAKVGPTTLDKEMMELLNENSHNTIVAANKIDRLKQSERKPALQKVKDELGAKNIIAYSAKTKEGRGELLNLVLG